MNRIVVFFSAIAVIAPAAHSDDSSTGNLPGIVLTHEIRTAFYEHAPSSLSAKVSVAVRSWCSSADREQLANSTPANAETVGWLCANRKLRFYRSVYVTGDKGPHVLVCEDYGPSSLKYFGMDMVSSIVTHGGCVPAEFDGTAYQLHFEDVNVEDDAIR